MVLFAAALDRNTTVIISDHIVVLHCKEAGKDLCTVYYPKHMVQMSPSFMEIDVQVVRELDYYGKRFREEI